MSLAVGLGRECCKLDDKGARCRPFCILADIEPQQIALMLRAYRGRLMIQLQATHDPDDKRELSEQVLLATQQIQALEAL